MTADIAVRSLQPKNPWGGDAAYEKNIAQPGLFPALVERDPGIGIGIESEDETFSQRFLLKQFRRYVPAVQCSMTP